MRVGQRWGAGRWWVVLRVEGVGVEKRLVTVQTHPREGCRGENEGGRCWRSSRGYCCSRPATRCCYCCWCTDLKREGGVQRHLACSSSNEGVLQCVIRNCGNWTAVLKKAIPYKLCLINKRFDLNT